MNKEEKEIMLKIAEKEYRQAWDNYENAIDHQDFNAQKLFADEIHRLRLKIKAIKEGSGDPKMKRANANKELYSLIKSMEKIKEIDDFISYDCI